MERRVLPTGVVGVGNALELRKAQFGDLDHSLLKGRIAEINAASERAAIASGAEPIDLKWAALGRDRGRVIWGRRQKDLGFEVGYEQRVTILGKTTTFPRGIATRSGRGYRCIDRGVNFKYLFTHQVGHGLESWMFCILARRLLPQFQRFYRKLNTETNPLSDSFHKNQRVALLIFQPGYQFERPRKGPFLPLLTNEHGILSG
jgi:hypothetical protein